MEILLTVALMYGITFALVSSKLLARPREYLMERSEFFYDLLSCFFCSGFYSGAISYFLLRFDRNSPWFDSIQGMVIYAFAGASISFILDSLLLALPKRD